MSICSGTCIFEAAEVEGGYGFRIRKDGEEMIFTRRPVVLHICNVVSTLHLCAVSYDTVSEADGIMTLRATVDSGLGSRYQVEDQVSADDKLTGSFLFHRSVTVLDGGEDNGFFTRIPLSSILSSDPQDYNFFGPGQWYLQNQYAPKTFMGADPSYDYHIYAETRFTLPLLAMQHIATGNTFVVAREKADVPALPEDAYPYTNLVPNDIQYVDEHIGRGSLGYSRTDGGMSLTYAYPCSEAGTPELVHNRRPSMFDITFPPTQFACVHHPSRNGFVSRCAIRITLLKEKDYHLMFRTVWRAFSGLYGIRIAVIDNHRLLDVEMNLVDYYTRDWMGGGMGTAYHVNLHTGQVLDPDYWFGFVGQETGFAEMFLRYGKRFDRPDYMEKGRKIIDFWVQRSGSDWGLPRVHYTVDEKSEWLLQHPSYLRNVSDGMENIISAYRYMRDLGEDHRDWLAFCVRIADWLIANAREDGTWCRAYDASDGSVIEDDPYNTTNIVRFLVMTYLVTKNEAYRAAALKAGDWCYENIHKTFKYIGGTPDNPNAMDKEAGIYATFCFQALYDLTGDKKWLDAWCRAADYTETWVYLWSFPLKCMKKPCCFDHCDITGQSNIATGHSANDVYMAACSYQYYRLYLITRDPHYLFMAKVLHANPKQVTDLNGDYGYFMPGLCHEACGFFKQFVGAGMKWVAWVSFVQIEPVMRLLDTFGAYEIDEAEAQDPKELQKKNRIYDF